MKTFDRRFRPTLETLERRILLAGIAPPPMLPPVPPPFVKLENLAMTPGDFLPGAEKPIAKINVSTASSGQFAQLTEMLFVPAIGSGSLAQNTSGFTLRAGSQILAYGSLDYNTDILEFYPMRPWYARSTVQELDVWAKISTYPGENTIGVEDAFAAFNNLRGVAVDNGNISYTGAQPTVHTLETAVISINQQYGVDPYKTVYAGDEQLSLLSYYMNVQGAIPGVETFVATQGSLRNIKNPTLVHIGWDGNVDEDIPGTFNANSTKLSFAIGDLPDSGGTWTVYADAANTTVGTPQIQLAFDPNAPITGNDNNTGFPLKGLLKNGTGADGGQIQVWSYRPATTFTIVGNTPKVVVTQIAPVNVSQKINPGDKNIVVGTFDVSATADTTFTHLDINAREGDVRSLTNYSLWVSIAGIQTKVASGMVIQQADTFRVSFNFSKAIVAGTTMRFFIHADAALYPRSGTVQLQIAGNKGVVFAKKPSGLYGLDEVFVDFTPQTDFFFYDNPYGLG